MTTHAQRAHLAKLMDALVFYNRRVHYAQVRPMKSTGIRHLRAALLRPGGLTMDCSECVTFLCRLAGLRDPNGSHYNGLGYTGTLLANLPHYESVTAAETGALVVFGPGSGHHVCMVRHAGSDPVLFSHGSEADPRYFRLSAMLPAFHNVYRLLSIAELGL